MDFGEILKKAWKIIWKHKILWLFGVLAGCMTNAAPNRGGSNGAPQAASSGSMSPGFWNPSRIVNPSLIDRFHEAIRVLEETPGWVWAIVAIIVIVLVFILTILLFMLGVLGTAGVIKGASMADQADPDAKPLSFKQIFKALKPYYWKVLLFNLGVNFAGLVMGILLAIPIILFVVFTCFLGLLILIPIGWFIHVMITFTSIAIIEEDKGIFEGISRAWHLLIDNLGRALLMFLILGIGQILIGIIIALPMLLVPIPLLINLMTTGFQEIGWGLIVSIIMLLVFMPVLNFLFGVLKAYVLTSWTLLFRHFVSKSDFEPTLLSPQAEENL